MRFLDLLPENCHKAKSSICLTLVVLMSSSKRNDHSLHFTLEIQDAKGKKKAPFLYNLESGVVANEVTGMDKAPYGVKDFLLG